MIYKMTAVEPAKLLVMPVSALEKIGSCSKKEICIFLEICAVLSHAPADEEKIIENLSGSFSADDVRSVLSFWRGVGVFSAGEEAESENIAAARPVKAKIDAEEVPFYSAKELGDAAETNADFKALVSFAEKRLEKIFNESELARLYSFLDYLKMPASVVMLSIEDCASRGKKSLRYISKQLIDFEENGADTYEKAEELLKKRSELNDYEHYVRSLFGLGERKLVAKEKAAVEAWKETFKFGREMLDRAYEKTVAAAKTPSISYMNKILEAWHRDGITSPDEIDKAIPKKDAEKSYELADFFEAAVAKKKKH